MKSVNKFFVVLVLVLISAFALSACATGTEDAATNTVAATQEPTAEAAATVEEAVEETVEAPTAEAPATVEASAADATVEATEEVAATEEATEEVAATEEATEEVAATEEATEEAVAEATAAPADDVTAASLSEIAKREGDVVSELAGTVTSVCLVTDLGRVNDGSFNQSAYNGMLAAANDFGLRSTFIETQSQADYAKNIQTCLDESYDAIITVGFLIADATREAAVANPETYFIGVDQFFAEPLPNLVGIQFREDQAGFLAGVMAALVSESGTIGGVYGEEIPPVVKFRNGFEQGAKYVNPDINVLGVYVGSFIDQPAGRETAENLIGEGADVIFGAGGPTGSAGIQAAAERGVKVIGVDQDEYLTTFGSGETPGAEFIITSAVKRIDQGVYDMLAALSTGTVAWATDSLYLMDAAVQGVGFAPAHDAEVAEDVVAQVEEVLALLASGELETGVDPVTGALLEAETTEEVATEEVAATEEVTEEAAATEEATEEVAATEETTEEVAATEEAVEAEPTAAPVDETTAASLTEIAKREGDVVSELAGVVTSVCLVTDLGRVNDGSFNQSAYNGMVAAASDFGLRSTFIETQTQADYAKNIQTCLDEGYGAIITVGFLIADATREAAIANPETYFIGVDQFFAEPLPNLVGIQFREDQAGFVVGVMAALVSESGTIGGVYGEEIPPVVKFRNGFEQGAKYINPDINTLGVYVGSFLDQPAGRETAENLIGEGADVIFGAGGPTGSAGIQAAAERGVKVIGVDQDEYLTTFGSGETPGAEFIITSAVKRVDQGVYDMLAALSTGTVAWPTDSLYLMDATVQGVGFAPSHDAEVAEDVVAQVEEVLAQLASGDLDTGVDPVTGALLEAEATE